MGETSFESFQRQEEARNAGIKKITEFLVRTVGKEKLSDPDVFTEVLRKMDFDSFTSTLSRVNGLINDVPPIEREDMFERPARVVQGVFEDLVELQPPPPEVSKGIMRETFEHLQQLAEVPGVESQQAIARTLYNAVIYLHPFKDGHGRTARLLYFLISPNVRKDSASIQDELPIVINAKSGKTGFRKKEVVEYHGTLNLGTYNLFLREREISAALNRERHFIAELRDTDAWGFDVEYLGFIAAYDAMTPEERQKYAKHEGDSGAFSFSFKDFPEDLRERMKKQKDKVREEFTRTILEGSVDNDRWPQWADEDLNKIFGVMPKGTGESSS